MEENWFSRRSIVCVHCLEYRDRVSYFAPLAAQWRTRCAVAQLHVSVGRNDNVVRVERASRF
jgi:hypothetical protein